jgi:hypothetical protein
MATLLAGSDSKIKPKQKPVSTLPLFAAAKRIAPVAVEQTTFFFELSQPEFEFPASPLLATSAASTAPTQPASPTDVSVTSAAVTTAPAKAPPAPAPSAPTAQACLAASDVEVPTIRIQLSFSQIAADILGNMGVKQPDGIVFESPEHDILVGETFFIDRKINYRGHNAVYLVQLLLSCDFYDAAGFLIYRYGPALARPCLWEAAAHIPPITPHQLQQIKAKLLATAPQPNIRAKGLIGWILRAFGRKST